MDVVALLGLCSLYGVTIHLGHDSISYWIEIQKGGYGKKFFIRSDALYSVRCPEYQVLDMINELLKKEREND